MYKLHPPLARSAIAGRAPIWSQYRMSVRDSQEKCESNSGCNDRMTREQRARYKPFQEDMQLRLSPQMAEQVQVANNACQHEPRLTGHWSSVNVLITADDLEHLFSSEPKLHVLTLNYIRYPALLLVHKGGRIL